MRPALVLRAHLTLFTRANCGLCDTAKTRIVELQKKRRVAYTEIDIMADGQKQWRDVYDFDVPVLHVEKDRALDTTPAMVSPSQKLMHRFTVAEVEDLIEKTEHGNA